MRIFFTGSITGGRSQQPNYEVIVEELKKYGEVLSDHVAEENISEYGETELQASEILAREMEMLKQCDMVVADVTNSSLGVGYLIAYASMQNKKVLALYRGHNTYKLSAIIKGDKNVKIFTYEYDDEIGEILKNNFPKGIEEQI